MEGLLAAAAALLLALYMHVTSLHFTQTNIQLHPTIVVCTYCTGI